MTSTKWSYLHEPMTKQYNYQTVCEFLEQMLENDPNFVAAIHCHLDGSKDKLTLADLCENSKIFAKHLINLGLKRHDRVLIIGSNSIPWMIGELGIIYAGCIAIHMALTTKDGSDVKEIIVTAKIKALLVGDLETSLTNVVTEEGNRHGLLVVHLQEHKEDVSLEKLLKKPTPDIPLPLLCPEDGAFVFSTSGSTGKPKLVQHSHQSILLMQIFEENNQRKTAYNDRPFCWLGGYPLVVICSNMTRVFMKSDLAIVGNNTIKIWECIKATKCTIALFMPYFIHDVLENADAIQKLDYKLDLVLSGGQIVENAEKLVGLFCNKVMVGYGQTETCMGAKMFITDSTQRGDVGTPTEGVEIRIALNDETTLLNTVGSIQMRGNGRCICYLDNPELSMSLFTQNNWLRTGDIGKITDEGHLVIQGRDKDLISRGTRKIIPAHIETIVRSFDGIKTVLAVGVPNKRLGEDVCVCYVVEEGKFVSTEDIKDYCQKLFLKDDAIDGLGEMPTYFIQFQSFPKTHTGKPDKIAVKKEAAKLLGL